MKVSHGILLSLDLRKANEKMLEVLIEMSFKATAMKKDLIS